MKQIIQLLLLLYTSCSFSQNGNIIKLFEEARNDSVKIDILKHFYDPANSLQADSMKYYYTLFKTISKKQDDKVAEAVNMTQMGYYLYLSGDQPQGLQLTTHALQIAEPTNNPQVLGMIYFCLHYFNRGNNDKRINLIRRALSFSKQANDQFFLTYEYRNLGHIYFNLKNADSAFYYYQTSYDLALKTKEASDITAGLIGLGRTNYLVGNKKIALEYYKSAAAINTKNIEWNVTALTEIAQFFVQQKNIDSAIYYAKQGYDIASSNTYIKIIIPPARILKDIYLKLNSDSALKYTIIYYNAMDSMYGRKKMEEVQTLNFDEEIRQQKIEEDKQKAKEERKHNLQYAAIAIALITFIIVFFLLSRSIIVKTKFIEFFGMLGLLAVFEFINLFIHPYLGHVTNHSPVLMLAVLIAIGALLIPLHHKLEKWITKIMVEKNKKIRLASAKKTIAALEGEQTN
ncbi:MAG TPA: tetratricopeptide repeat protein [Chitinophagaceae bacterium]|nr:tetratricopeptide repeat protein [Chitinophagaceae bacterium]